MKGNYLNKLLKLGANHSLYRDDGKWYHNLKRFPGVLFDKNGYVIFENENEYKFHPDLQIKKDLHISMGIESLKKYRRFSETDKLLIENSQALSSELKGDSENVIRVIRQLDIILRNKYLVQKIKDLYQNTCQLCTIRINIAENKYYSEIHHIIPLGRPHNGKDSMENMICVCPNCHVLLDLKVIKLQLDTLKNIQHEISIDSINYHNSEFNKL